MAVATYVLEVNWAGDATSWNAGDGTWVAETAYMLSAKWQRGRDYASALTGRVQSGQFRAQLDNNTGRFSPFNASSPLFGMILPTRRIRLRTTSPSAVNLWSGFLDSILPNPGARVTGKTALLSASGPLAWVAFRESNTALYTNILAGDAVEIVLDDAGWPAGDRTIDDGQVLMATWKADTGALNLATSDVKKALSHLQEIEECELGLISESKSGYVVFEDVHHRLLAPHTTAVATFSDASGAALPYETIEELDPWRTIFNRWVAEVITFATGGSAALWTLAGDPPFIPPGQSIVITAVYPNPASPNGSDHVTAWGVVSLTANSQSNGGGVDLTSSITVDQVKTANTEQITLTNGSATGAYITALDAFGTPSTRDDPSRVISEDVTSQEMFGKRTYPLGGKFYPTVSRAQQFTDFGLSRYKDPQPLLNIGFCANDSAALMAQMLARDISDRITVVASGTTPSGAGLGISSDFFIEAELHTYDLKEHTVIYRLSFAGDATATGDGGYWTVGISEIGETTRVVV